MEDGVDGILVEEGNVEALADGVLRLIKDENLRLDMGAAAYVRSERYSEEAVMEQWTELFNKLAE